MNPQSLALFLALGATLVFAVSSLVYAEFSKRVSVLWMNAFKSTVAFLLLSVSIPIFLGGWSWPGVPAVTSWFLSGLIGLNIGDLFLLAAFTRLGAGRTLILFGFSPLLVGTAAYFAFDQALDPTRFLAVLFLIGCLFSFSLEKYKQEKRWEILGLVFALIGVSLDACGILLTRWGFDQAPLTNPLESHFWRCFGAVVGFSAMSLVRPIGLLPNFLRWNGRERTRIFAASACGTFLSLILIITAIKIGHLASITAIGITGPMFATFLECALKRQKPSPYLLAALGFFGAGFWVLLRDPSLG